MKAGNQSSVSRWCLALSLALLAASSQAATPEVASAPLSAAIAKPLAQLLSNQPLTQWRLTTLEEAIVTQLVRQNLHQLDPENQLLQQGSSALISRLRGDIRPVVHQVLTQMAPSQYRARLQQALAASLTAAQAGGLQHWFATPQGTRYLHFSQQLDTLVAAGLNQLANQPIALRREQMPDATIWQQRQRLLTMASASLAWQAARPDSAQPAALGILRDMLCLHSGAALDQLSQQYQADLPAFQAFEHSTDGQALQRAQRQWAQQEGERLQPLMQQAQQRLLSQQATWQALADSWRRAPAP